MQIIFMRDISFKPDLQHFPLWGWRSLLQQSFAFLTGELCHFNPHRCCLIWSGLSPNQESSPDHVLKNLLQPWP